MAAPPKATSSTTEALEPFAEQADTRADKGRNTGIVTGRYIGKRVARKEDRRLLTGRGQFVDDVVLPGMLHLAFARSAVARGRIQAIRSEVAQDVEGVHAVYTQQDLATIPVDLVSMYLVSPEVPTTVMADGRVCYVGEPVALVIADSRAIAEDAASLIEIDYAEENPVISIADSRDGPAVHPDCSDNINAQMGEEEIDDELAAILDGAPHRIEHSVVHARIAQSPMETRGVVASPEGSGELTVYISCQSPHLTARWMSIAFDMPETAVRVIAKDVGGGFGFKIHPWREEVAAIVAALKIGRPVKWIEDRYENLVASNHAREQEMTLQIALDNDGRLLASHGDYSVNVGAFPHLSECNIAVHMFVWAAYKMPTYGFLTRGWYTNTAGYGGYRGPWAMETLIRETALDKAARKIGIDAIELRRRNLVRLQDQPWESCMQIPLEDITPAECLEKLLHYFDVAAFREQQANARNQGRYLGLGIATYIEPTGSAGSITTMTGELAQVRIDPTGRVTATMSTHSQGHGTQTTMAQIFADRLGVPIDSVTIYEGDSSRGGYSPGAAGSRQGVVAGGAAMQAADLLAAKVKRLAAHLHKVSPDTIVLDDGWVKVAGADDKNMPLSQLAELAYGEPDQLPEGMEPGLEAQYRYQPPPLTFASAANACVVEVDADTGFVSILRWISSEDCGTPINPAIVEGQVAGGLAQAIGMVLHEEVAYDPSGNPIAATYKDYHLPAITDVPEFEFVHANTPSQSVGGMRGVGEGGAIIGPPTLVNAIADALAPFGEISVNLPLHPGKLLSVIEGRDLNAAVKHEDKPIEKKPEPAKPVAEVNDSMPPADIAIDGDWKIILSTPVGPQEMIGHFETDGELLSGYLSAAEGHQEFTGRIEDGNRLLFDLKVTKPMKLTLKYNITIDGNKLSGKCKMGIFGSAKLNGQKVSP